MDDLLRFIAASWCRPSRPSRPVWLWTQIKSWWWSALDRECCISSTRRPDRYEHVCCHKCSSFFSCIVSHVLWPWRLTGWILISTHSTHLKSDMKGCTGNLQLVNSTCGNHVSSFMLLHCGHSSYFTCLKSFLCTCKKQSRNFQLQTSRFMFKKIRLLHVNSLRC